MESEKKKTLICFDALNWLTNTFWNNNADLEYCANPWEALRHSDRTVGTFVRAARNADFELVVVASGSPTNPDIREKCERRREENITNEKRSVCLQADMFLAESFMKHGVRVVRPVGAGANDVLAALADSHDHAVIVSRNGIFFRYDRALSVSRDFTVRGGKLLLDRAVTRDRTWWTFSERTSETSPMSVQPHLALAAMGDEESWTIGHDFKHRPSIWTDGRVVRGSSSSSDRRMGNLQALARPLRAAVYAILGEHSALERIPEWSNEEWMVVWTETQVVADPALSSVVQDPRSALEWLVKHDTPVAQLEPWRAAERHFNMCCLAAELVAVSSRGSWTMHKCMELFSNDEEIAKRAIPLSPRADTSLEQAMRPGCKSQDTRRQLLESMDVFDKRKQTKFEPALQHLSSQPILQPASAETAESKNETVNESSLSTARSSIFGIGRSREEVLEEREKQKMCR